MAFNVDTLIEYIDEQRLPLIGKSVLSPKSAKLLNLQTGVKGKSALNLLDTTTYLQDGSTCGFTDSGSTSLSQRVIEVAPIKINKKYCDKDLLKYWAGYIVKTEAGIKTLPFQEDFINQEIAKIGELLETSIWQGDKNSSNVNLNKFDGLIKIFDSVSGSTVNVSNSGVTGVTSITVAAVMTYIEDIFANIPVQLLAKPNVSIVCGSDIFRKYVIALKNANLFHYTYNMEAGMELIIPGTNVKLIALDGLNGTNRMFAGQFDTNVFYGTDLEGSEEKFELWYSQDNRDFRFEVTFTVGVQVAYPSEIVRFKLA